MYKENYYKILKHYTHHAQVTAIMYLYIVTCPLERDLSQIFYFFKWLNRLLVTKLGASLWIMVLDQFPGHSWNLLTLLDNQTCDIPMSNKLRLECTFTGPKKTYVTWYKDGKQLYVSYRYNAKVTKNSCILECLHERTKDTTGNYFCKVSNYYGKDICHAKIITITGF